MQLLLMVVNIFILYTQHNGMPHINPLNAELNPICHLLALLGTHHILHVSRIKVKVNYYYYYYYCCSCCFCFCFC